MVKKISVIDIQNETDDEEDYEEENDTEETIEDEKVNVVEFNATKKNKPGPQQLALIQPEAIKQKTVEQHQCKDCLKYMSLKSLRYSHAKYCTAKFHQPAPKLKPSPTTRIKKESSNNQNDYENLRQINTPKVIQQAEAQPIQQVRMKTVRERKQEKYSDMMENAFYNYYLINII